MLPFAVVMIAIVTGVHYYLYMRLGRDPLWPGALPQVIKWALISVAIAMPMTLMVSRLLPRNVSNVIAWPIFIWMGLMFYLLVGLVLSEPVRFLVQATVVDEERRTLMARGLALLVGGGAIAAVGLGVKNALSALHVNEVTFTLPKWPKALDGFRIVQLTDIHVGATIGHEFIDDMVKKTNALNPDLIALTGDLVDGSVAELSSQVAPLAFLKARLGAFFVTGNHEYYSGADEWLAHVASLGLRALRNEHLTLGEGETAFILAGVDDYDSARFGHKPSVAGAVATRRETKTKRRYCSRTNLVRLPKRSSTTCASRCRGIRMRGKCGHGAMRSDCRPSTSSARSRRTRANST